MGSADSFDGSAAAPLRSYAYLTGSTVKACVTCSAGALASWQAVSVGIVITLVSFTLWLMFINAEGMITSLLPVLLAESMLLRRTQGIWVALVSMTASFAVTVAANSRSHRPVGITRGGGLILRATCL